MEWKVPRRMRRRVSAEKKLSTALSQEPEVGVKWNTQRGWRLSHSNDLGLLVGGIVVEHGMDHLAWWYGSLDGVEEADQLLMAVALHAAADDGAVENVQCRKQSGGAVALDSRG